MKTCPVCNKKFADVRDMFCEECGVMLVEDAAPADNGVKKGADKNKIVIIVLSVLLAAVVIGVILFFVFGMNRQENSDTVGDETPGYVQQEDEHNHLHDDADTPADADVIETTTEKVTVTAAETTTVRNSGFSVVLNATEYREMNMFLSNFAEVYFGDYDSDNVNAGQLIDFAILHGYINDNSSVANYNGVSTISTEYASKYISRFFGKSVNFRDTQMVVYNADTGMLSANTDVLFYTCADHTENGYTLNFATTDRVTDNGDGTYSVDFYVMASPRDSFGKYYSYTYDELSGMRNVYRIGYGSAVIRVEGDMLSDSYSYQLVKYNVSY